MTATLTTKALVSYGPLAEDGWKLDEVNVRPIGDEELLVQVVATGICHTDVLFAGAKEGWSVFYPKIAGHEGSGYVKQVGSKVTVAQPGDPVLLSFKSCGECNLCETGHPAYCYKFAENFFGNKVFHSKTAATATEPDITGSFFGQSSFANLTVASQRSVVNVKGLVQDDEELKLFSPLGCGFQTGSGAIVNVADAKPEDEIVILGLGGVGLTALMAAKLRNCKSIVAIDRVNSRLELAKTLGATATINTTDMSMESITEAVKAVTSGLGPTISFDSVGAKTLLTTAVEFTRNRGKIIQVGSTPMDMKIEIPTFPFMCAGKQYIGVIEGDAEPWKYVPEMIKWHREGKFPIEKLVKFFKPEEFKDALQEMHAGGAVKPVIVW